MVQKKHDALEDEVSFIVSKVKQIKKTTNYSTRKSF